MKKCRTIENNVQQEVRRETMKEKHGKPQQQIRRKRAMTTTTTTTTTTWNTNDCSQLPDRAPQLEAR